MSAIHIKSSNKNLCCPSIMTSSTKIESKKLHFLKNPYEKSEKMLMIFEWKLRVFFLNVD